MSEGGDGLETGLLRDARNDRVMIGRSDFLRILEAHGAPEHVKRHCMAVGDAAVNICGALLGAGSDRGRIDAEAVRLAGYLHDMARAGRDHDVVGASMLRDMDFEGILGARVSDGLREAAADIIERHMRLDFPAGIVGVDSAVVVALADRTVKEDAYVGYKARMKDLVRRYADVPEVLDRVRENMDRTLGLIREIEALTGRSFEDIATGGHVNIAPLLPLVERPGRYIGGEMGSTRKEWGDAAFRFCFAFPDLYEIGMSYTGMQVLYGLLNERPDVVCERAFAVGADMAGLLAERGLPLFSLENRMPVRRFDMVGFTLQHELCYTNVLRMLGQAGIPLYASERGDGDPIVISGGPCTANAEPMAPFFDLVCVGDGEEVLAAIADVWIEWSVKDDREAFLRACSRIQGVYAPGFYEPVYGGARCDAFPKFSQYTKKYQDLPDYAERAVVPDLETAFFPVKPLVSHIESVHDRVAVEIMRGCYRKCRFCQAGYACAGVRKRSAERIKQLIFDGLANTGYDEVTLLSLSTGDYPGIEGLVTELMEELSVVDATLSMPSLRLDTLKEDTLAKIAAYKRSGLTFAPEAGTQRLRDAIGKQITEDDILRALDICLPLGFQKFKFYFMIGLPGETDEDIDGIAELAGRVVRYVKELGVARGEKYRFNLNVSVSNFVPKPGTPFERVRGNSEEELIAKVHRLKDAVRKVKGVGFKYHDTRMSRVEMLLAKGDRRVSEAIRLAAERGTGFDSWREHFSYENWLSAFADAGLPAEDMYFDDCEFGDTVTKNGIMSTLPWSIIAQGKAYE